jgi:hypothetical protein
MKSQDQFPFVLFVAKTDGHSTTLDWNVVSKMSAEFSRHFCITLCTDDFFYSMWDVTVSVWPL